MDIETKRQIEALVARVATLEQQQRDWEATWESYLERSERVIERLSRRINEMAR